MLTSRINFKNFKFKSRNLKIKKELLSILNNKNELRPVVKIWEAPATANPNQNSEKEKAARQSLKAVLDSLR